MDKMPKYTILTIALSILASAVMINGATQGNKGCKLLQWDAKKCIKETGASQSDFSDWCQYKPASGPAAEKFRTCMLKKFGVLNAKGELNKVDIMKIVKMVWRKDPTKIKKAEKVVDECLKIKPPEDISRSGSIVSNCIAEQSKKAGLI